MTPSKTLILEGEAKILSSKVGGEWDTDPVASRISVLKQNLDIVTEVKLDDGEDFALRDVGQCFLAAIEPFCLGMVNENVPDNGVHDSV